jgi:hypothetical protein
MNFTEAIVKAVNLYRDCMSNENAEIDIELEKCIIYYVPKMIHSHRNMWTQEDLLIFYPTYDIDFGTDTVSAKDSHRRIYFYPISLNANTNYEFKKIVAGNMHGIIYDDKFPDELMPEHFIIDGNDFKRGIA